MTEEFDVTRAFDISNTIQFGLALLSLALVAELVIRVLGRLAKSKDWRYLHIIFSALAWHPLFWALVLGIGRPFIQSANNPIVRRGLEELLVDLLLISLTIIAVRIAAGLDQGICC